MSVKDTSDGYHTFGELYEHRYALFIALCAAIAKHWPARVWRSQKHSDGSMFDDSFIMGIDKSPGRQITYHLPMRLWDAVEFARELPNAPLWDGHDSAEVVTRIWALHDR